MLIQGNLSVQEKLKIFMDAAKYDVACTFSRVRRKGKTGSIGNTSEAGICHSFSTDGKCIFLLKILFTNQCIYDCKYCVNRCSNDVVRIAFTPDEVCKFTAESYRRNCIEGLFLSSGILYNANHTMGLIYETPYKLRNQWHFNGYIHVEIIPGTDSELMERMGFLVDRMSINLELPTAEGPKNLAPGKIRDKILKSMHQVQRGIAVSDHLLGYGRELKKPYATERVGFAGSAALIRPGLVQSGALLPGNHGLSGGGQGGLDDGQKVVQSAGGGTRYLPDSRYARTPFVPAGQSTQTIVGVIPENDYQMMAVIQALYESYGLERVLYSAYVPINDGSCLPSVTARPPSLREYRLYQADWLLRLHGSKAEELLSEGQPNFSIFLNPKCGWALRHLKLFPMEINRASYGELLRAPGMGVKSVQRIVNARKQSGLRLKNVKKMEVVLKRARYFTTCNGRMVEGARSDQDYITSCLAGDRGRRAWDTENRDSFRQLTLFDDMHLEMPVTGEDHYASVTGSP